MIVSVELLSKVIGCCYKEVKILDYGYLSNYKNFIFVKYINKYGSTCNIDINTHELAHKVKEWSLKEDFILSSGSYKIGGSFCEIIDILIKEVITADTEPEAIFKAGQWILDNKDKQ